MKIKRLISAILAVILCASCMGVTTMAEETTKPEYLVNTLYKLKVDKELKVGYFGGSVTEGTGLYGEDVEKYSWRALSRDWFKANFPEAAENVVEVRASIGGTGSLYGVFRADDMLIGEKAPDINFIEFAINDHYDGIANKNQNYVYIETIVRKIYKSNPNADIIFVITGANAQLQTDATSDIPLFGYQYQCIAKKYDIPILYAGYDLIKKLYKENNNSYPSQTGELWGEYFIDIVHPKRPGYESYAETVNSFLAKNLLTSYTPTKADVVDFTKAEGYETTYCEANKKDDGTITVDLMMDADIVRTDEIKDSQYMGTFTEDIVRGVHPAITSSKSNAAVATFEFNASNLALWIHTFGDQAPGTFVNYSIDGGAEQMLNLNYTSTNHMFVPIVTGLESGKNHTIRINHKEMAGASFQILYFLVWDVVDGQEAYVRALPYYDFTGDYSVTIDGYDFADFDPKKTTYEIAVDDDSAYPQIGFSAKDYNGYSVKQASAKSSTATLSIDNVGEYKFKFVKKAKSETVTLKYDTNGASEIAAQTVKTGAAAVRPADPAREGFVFDGWYKDAALTERFNFGSSKINYNTEVFARWLTPEEVANRMVLTIDKKEATVFGKDATNDVAPVIRNGRTMLPARFVAENLGAEIKWDEKTRKVTVSKGDVKITITIDAAKATVKRDGVTKSITLDSPAFIENSRTYTPVRFIVENFGAKIEWKEDERQVVIIK